MFTCNNNLLRTVPASCTPPAYTTALRVFAMGLKLLLLLSLAMIRLDSSWVLAACHCAQVMCLNRSMIDLKVLCQAGAGLCPAHPVDACVWSAKTVGALRTARVCL